MRFAVAMIVAPLAWSACSVAGTAQGMSVERGKAFSLKAGQVATVRDSGVRIGFEGVTGDSRCPKGERCVWAGEATVRVWLQQGAGPKETRELRGPSDAQAASTVRALGHDVRLLRLDPYPVTGKAIAPSDYSATLTVAPALAAPAALER